MAQKRIGPTNDAGVVLIEKSPQASVQASMLGSTGYVGILDRGPVGELIICTGKKELLRQTGGYIPDSLLPDVAVDFWDHSEGAGIMFLYRVTDGSEVKSSLTLYDRKSPRNAVCRFDAHDGGSWGGRREQHVVDLTDPSTDIDETAITLPLGYIVAKNFWKGATVKVSGANAGQGALYKIVSNTAGTIAVRPVLTLAADATAYTDYGIATDPEVIITADNLDEYGRNEHLAILVKDGQLSPSTQWGCEVYLNDELVAHWDDLSSDPTSKDYFVEVINRDESNCYVTVTDLWTGAITADVRPANHFGSVTASTDVVAKVLSLKANQVIVDDSEAGDNTIGAFTFGADVIPDTYELEYGLVGTTNVWTLTSLTRQAQHEFPAAHGSVAYVADNALSIGFTVTESTPSEGEKFTIIVLPLREDEAIGGRIFFPDESDAPAAGWYITDNTEGTVTITSGDLTLDGDLSGTVKYRLQYRQEMWGGYDGIADVDETDFLPAYDVNTSPFLETSGGGYGLIKFATPGITELFSGGSDSKAITVEKAGAAFADAANHQYRYEIPRTTTTDAGAKSRINDTLGRSDYAGACFPAFARVSDPVKSGLLKWVPQVGVIHGREAKTARNWDGYHKVAAGIDVTLPKIKELTTGTRVIDGELLNPVGIQRIIKKQGNFVVWGARVPASNSGWKWKQQRELLSYYEHVLAESFDWIIFAINDPQEQPGAVAALKDFFVKEWRKRAIRGNKFDDACKIKIDAENNTDATRASGDLNAEITLQLADTVERFVITISKAGIFESVA